MSCNSPKGDNSSTTNDSSNIISDGMPCIPLSPQSPAWSVSSKGSVNSTGYITPMRVKTPPLSQDRSHQAYLPHSEICDRSVANNCRDGFVRSSSPGYVISRPRSQDRSHESFPLRPVNSGLIVPSRGGNQPTQNNIQSRVRSFPLSLDPSNLSHTQSQESPGRNISRNRDNGSAKSRDQISETSIPINKSRSSDYYRSRPLSPR